jgi:hypothetical protein
VLSSALSLHPFLCKSFLHLELPFRQVGCWVTLMTLKLIHEMNRGYNEKRLPHTKRSISYPTFQTYSWKDSINHTIQSLGAVESTQCICSLMQKNSAFIFLSRKQGMNKGIYRISSSPSPQSSSQDQIW